MPDKEVAAHRIVTMPADLYARQQIAKQIEADRKAGVKLDEAKRPGGYFLGADGKAHDAEGRPIEQPAVEDAADADADAKAKAEAEAKAKAEAKNK